MTWPFAPEPVYAEYLPLKAAQVKRALGAAFSDAAAMIGIVNEGAENPLFVKYLTKRGKPKPKDFEKAFKMFYYRQLPTRQLKSVTELAHDVCSAWDVYQDGAFKEQFGVDPHPGLAEIAKKLYRET